MKIGDVVVLISDNEVISTTHNVQEYYKNSDLGIDGERMIEEIETIDGVTIIKLFGDFRRLEIARFRLA